MSEHDHRPHATAKHAGSNAAEGAPGGAPPLVPTNEVGKVRRAWRRAKAWAFTFMLWFSSIGTGLMLLYQFFYSWGYDKWDLIGDGANAWVVALVMLVFYVISKLPHIFGQEPGDVYGLVREVFLGIANLVLSVIFLTRVYDGMASPPNAVGISVMLCLLFLVIITWQIVQGMRLAIRSWADQTGGV